MAAQPNQVKPKFDQEEEMAGTKVKVGGLPGLDTAGQSSVWQPGIVGTRWFSREPPSTS
jgi:hypothetical protein